MILVLILHASMLSGSHLLCAFLTKTKMWKCTKTQCFSIVFEHWPFQLQRQIILNFRCTRLRNKPSFQGFCGHGFLVVFFNDFGIVLGSKIDAKWGPKSAWNLARKKKGSRPPRNASRRLLRPQDAARSRLRPKKAPTWPPKTSASEGF